MGQPIQRNNTTQGLPFLMVLSSDHITGATSKTVTVTICKNGGAFAAPLGTVSEIASGWYELAANATDANTLGPLLLHATATGCDPRDSEFAVVDYNPSLVLPSSPPSSATFGTTTARTIINGAFDLLGVKAAGETMPADAMQDALRRLNLMIDGWGLQPGTILNQTREVFNLAASQASYTMGPGGDFDTVRPVWVQGFGLVLNTSTLPVEIELDSFTDASWEAIRVKTQTSTQPTGAYFNATAPLATVYVWPIPTSSLNDLVIYSLQAGLGFTNLSTQYALAAGYAEAIEYNLATRLAASYGRSVPPDVTRTAAQTLTWVKTSNTRAMDLSLDPALTFSSRRSYNILSDR